MRDKQVGSHGKWESKCRLANSLNELHKVETVKKFKDINLESNENLRSKFSLKNYPASTLRHLSLPLSIKTPALAVLSHERSLNGVC